MRRGVVAGLVALVSGIACTLASGLALAAPPSIDELMARLAKVPASRAEFVETKTVALLAKPLVLTGSLSYVRPKAGGASAKAGDADAAGLLERHTKTPFEERMTVRGDEITLDIPAKGQKRTFSVRVNPVLWGFVESIRATMAGDRRTLERFYWVRVSGEGDRWTVDLEPRDAAMSQYVQAIRLSGAGSRMERVEVFEANGDRSDMRIKPA